MDIAYHGEDFAREHKDVLDNIRVDHPLKVPMDTAWVYAQAADQYQYGDVEDARQTQKSARQAYNNAMRLLVEHLASYPNTGCWKLLLNLSGIAFGCRLIEVA
jgi:hypothetical protein